MMTVEERNEILSAVQSLYGQRDAQLVVALLADLPREELLAEPRLGLKLATAWRALGQNEPALELTRDLEEACRWDGDSWAARSRLLLEAGLLFEHGELASAEEAFLRVLEMARRAGDPETGARAANSLGVMASLRGHFGQALASYARASVCYQELGDSWGLTALYLNMGLTYREWGRYLEADSNFRRCLELARTVEREDVLPIVEFEWALLRHWLGDSRLAELTARRALYGLQARGNERGSGEALRVLGIIAADQGRREEAGAHLRHALELARRTANRLLEAQVQEELARLAQDEGDAAALLHGAGEAQRIYDEIGAELYTERLRDRFPSASDDQ